MNIEELVSSNYTVSIIQMCIYKVNKKMALHKQGHDLWYIQRKTSLFLIGQKLKQIEISNSDMITQSYIKSISLTLVFSQVYLLGSRTCYAE